MKQDQLLLCIFMHAMCLAGCGPLCKPYFEVKQSWLQPSSMRWLKLQCCHLTASCQLFISQMTLEIMLHRLKEKKRWIVWTKRNSVPQCTGQEWHGGLLVTTRSLQADRCCQIAQETASILPVKNACPRQAQQSRCGCFCASAPDAGSPAPGR